jgi:hypothetical protein
MRFGAELVNQAVSKPIRPDVDQAAADLDGNPSEARARSGREESLTTATPPEKRILGRRRSSVTQWEVLMLTPESRSNICAINLAFAAEFARERANRPDDQWFDLVANNDTEKERRYESMAPYLARQKERTLAREAELREAQKQRSESAPPPSSKRRSPQ